VILRPFEYVECATIDDAVKAVVAHGDDARLIAGGTALVPLMKHQIIRPRVLVSLAGIPGLDAIEPGGHGALSIGALATHHDVARSAHVRAIAPLLAHACSRVASPTIRAMGTLGGNLCYGESASDPSPALLALGAQATLAGPGGERIVPLAQFFTGFYETALADGEVLVRVTVPAMPAGARWRYLKWTPRAREDKALVGLAVVLQVEDGRCRLARLAVGGVASSPVPLVAAAQALEGRSIDDRTIAGAADAAAMELEPMDDLQGTAVYRRDMLRLWTRRVLHELAREVAG
jgi:carbon-monoxide dehydrogenase medium subunit